MRKRNSRDGRMLDMLRAMNAYVGDQDDGGAVEAAQDAVTCPTCGAPVESGALKKQTMADGSLMWPRPFCRACLLAGLKRLDAELRQPGKDGE